MDKDVLPAPIGPYRPAVWAGPALYVSGQLPLDPVAGRITAEGIADQTRQALANLGSILRSVGLDYTDVVKTTCLLADIADFGAFNAEYAAVFAVDPPARSCFAVKDLPQGALIEIESIAIKN
jgi:2-iminobutanoate/2-iminopropanoate deaminase